MLVIMMDNVGVYVVVMAITIGMPMVIFFSFFFIVLVLLVLIGLLLGNRGGAMVTKDEAVLRQLVAP